jgi:hypothetical protein
MQAYDRDMPPDRFDDVEFRIIDAPEPRPRRGRRWAAAGAATVLAVGALAAGASALTGGDDTPPAAAPPTKDTQQFHHRFGHRGHGCHHHDGGSGWSGYAPDASKL